MERKEPSERRVVLTVVLAVLASGVVLSVSLLYVRTFFAPRSVPLAGGWKHADDEDLYLCFQKPDGAALLHRSQRTFSVGRYRSEESGEYSLKIEDPVDWRPEWQDQTIRLVVSGRTLTTTDGEGRTDCWQYVGKPPAAR